MNIWFYLWALISLGLLGFSAWTYLILFKQKKAWRDFAKKHKLRIKSAAFMQSPKVGGIYKDYTIGIFTSEHEVERGTSSRKMTAIEIELDSRMPISGAFASGGLTTITQAMNFSEEFKPSFACWNSDNIARGDDRAVMEEYFTKERAEALCTLMEKKNAWVILIFKGNDMLLRLDTPDPFETQGKLTATVDALIDVAKALELGKSEAATLKSILTRRNTGAPKVDISEKEMQSIGLELEEDTAHAQPDVEIDIKEEPPEEKS